MENNIENVASEVEKALKRIRPHVWKTPLEDSAYLAQKTGAKVLLKLESDQVTGSFKVRGAFNIVLKRSIQKKEPDEIQKKLYTASSGNHGLALTLALSKTTMEGVVFVPNSVDKSKEERLLLHGADLRKAGNDCIETEEAAQRAAKEEDGVYVSPYNDLDIIAGQGTISAEIFQDVEKVDAIFVTVGGGGLMSGIACHAKHISPSTQIIGCSPIKSNAMEQSVKLGKVIDVVSEDTLSDGSAGNIDHNTMTFPLCQHYVDRWVSVTEEEIADAMFLMMDVHHKVFLGRFWQCWQGEVESALRLSKELLGLPSRHFSRSKRISRAKQSLSFCVGAT